MRITNDNTMGIMAHANRGADGVGGVEGCKRMNDLIVMNQSDAVKWLGEVGNQATRLRDLLYTGYQQKAWVALGYLTWSDCLKAISEKFDLSLRRIKQLDSANKTQRSISNTNDEPGFTTNSIIPERHLRPLTSLEPEVQREVWEEVIETAPDGKVTAVHVERVVKAHVSHATGENEWYTPPEYTDAARRVMGGIDLDPASSDVANESVKAAAYFTEDDDGLERDWRGRVWMNPPYAQPLISHFCEKLIWELDCGVITEAITLTNNATETKWFRVMAKRCSAICFPAGRIRFIDKDGNPGGAPLQGQAILYFGPSTKVNKFADEFGQFGLVFYAR